jgi:phosphoribosyl-ATP pyrophosphohydrolase
MALPAIPAIGLVSLQNLEVEVIQRLYEIIKDRQTHPKAGSYTNQLMDAGVDRLAQKVGEEAVELVIAATRQSRQRVIEEASDLVYHMLVLLVKEGISLAEIEDELARRHQA